MSQNHHLFPGLIGNGRLLVCLNERGEGRRLFWPEVDYGQHLQRYALALAVDNGPTYWLDDPVWQPEQRYLGRSNVLQTSLRHPEGWEVSLTDVAVPAPVATWREAAAAPPGDAWVRRLHVRAPRACTLHLHWLVAARLDEHPLAQSVFFDEAGEALFFYRRDRFLAMGADVPAAAFSCGHPDQVWQEAAHHHFNLRSIHMGEPAGGLRLPLGSASEGEEVAITLFLGAATSHEAAGELLDYWRRAGPDVLPAAERAWEEWLADAVAAPAMPAGGADVAAPVRQAAVYERSLLLLPLLQNAESGGVIAAPEFDSHFAQSGGYGFTWGRDAAFVAIAMDRAGLHGLARKAYLWAAKSQRRDGWWIQRHYTSGHWAPSWGLLQVDETGALLFGMVEHYRQTGDDAFLQTVWPVMARAAEYLADFAHASTGLPGPSVDLWEERTGDFTYAAAACWAGLNAVAQLADRRGEPAAALWAERAAAMQAQALAMLWSDEHGRFLRARALEVYPDWAHHLEHEGKRITHEPGPKGSLRHLLDQDATVDASLLGVGVPFHLVPPDDKRLVATAEAVGRELRAADGGICRYQWDGYRGGNPWVLCTLWLGLVQAGAGNWAGARQALQYATDHANAVGYLPEQVDANSGQPAWVLPLTWSHAMFILLYQELQVAGKL